MRSYDSYEANSRNGRSVTLDWTSQIVTKKIYFHLMRKHLCKLSVILLEKMQPLFFHASVGSVCQKSNKEVFVQISSLQLLNQFKAVTEGYVKTVSSCRRIYFVLKTCQISVVFRSLSC